jgi:UPF0755 protein
MTDEEGTEEGWPVRRHARPSEAAVPWPGGDGAAPNGAVPSGSAGPGGWPSGNGPLPADYGVRPDRHGTVPNYALPPNPGGQAPGRHGAPGNARGRGYPRDGGYPDDGRSPRDGRNRRDLGNHRNVEDPPGAAFPAGRGPARADSYPSDRGPFGDEDPPRDGGYEQGDRPPGHRPRGGHRPEDPFQRGELYDPNDSGDLDDPGGRYPAEREYPQDEPEPEPGAYRGRRRGKASSAPDAPGPGRGRRDDHVAHHAEGSPWDDEAYPDDAYKDDRFVPGLGAPRYRDDDTEDGDEEDDDGERRDRTAAGRPRRRRSRWIAPLVALVVILTPLVIGAVYVLHLYMSKYHPADYASDGTGQAIVEVQSGQTATAVGQRLVTLGVVASVRAFELAAEHSTNQRGLEPGFYRMHKQMKATLAFALLLNPAARIQDKITIPEGWRISQTEAELAAKSGIPAGDYKQALANPGSLGLPSYADGKPEGYLFPATYEVQPNQTATDVLLAMVQRFDQEAASINLPQAAASVHLSPSQVITLASLIQAEGGSTSYYPQIARVIYNRLAQNMPLQLDSTVMYALNTFGIVASDQQLQTTSPYNTYKYKGLPPGPIDSPGNAAIEAALHPSSGKDLYFVTVNPKTGLTEFTASQATFEQLREELEQNLRNG